MEDFPLPCKKLKTMFRQANMRMDMFVPKISSFVAWPPCKRIRGGVGWGGLITSGGVAGEGVITFLFLRY